MNRALRPKRPPADCRGDKRQDLEGTRLADRDRQLAAVRDQALGQHRNDPTDVWSITGRSPGNVTFSTASHERAIS